MNDPRRTPKRGAHAKSQRGGFAAGLVVGVLVGLLLSLAVALYVTKVPIPFINKVPQRTAVQDAAEVEKNRDWDPNSALSSKNPPRTGAGAGTGTTASPNAGPTIPPQMPPAAPPATLPSAQPAPPIARAAPTLPASVPAPARDPAAILGDKPAATAQVAASPFSRSGPDPFLYFVQAGAYGRTEDAEQQRAKLALMGVGGKVSEREQAGRTVYRVRVGPFDRRADADAAKERLSAAGVDAALVRVQR